MWTKLKKFATESNKIAQKIRFLLNNAETIEIDETYNPDLDKLEALETELKTKTLQLEHSVSKELGQQDLIAHLRAFNKKLKSDFSETTLKIKLQFEILKNECERSKSSKKLLQEETTKINTENQEYKIKIEFYAARIEKLNETCKILQNKIDELQKTPRIVKVKSPVDNNTLKLQILKEEIFKKDTELVRKTKEIIKLEQDLIDLKESVQLIRLKAQIAEGDWFEKYKTILEDKDKELEILKGMLRGSYSELKLRESKVSLLRKRNLPNPNLNREHSRGNTTLI